MRQFKAHCIAGIALILGALCAHRANAQCGTAVVWHDGGDPTAMLATPNRLFAAGPNFLRVFDTTDQDHPVLASTFVLDGSPREIEHAGGYLYVALGERGVQIIDANNPAAPANIYSLAGVASDVTVTNNTLFIASNGELRVYDVANPATPSFVTVLPLSTLKFVESRNNIVYAAGARDLHTINVSNPAAPNVVDTIAYGDLILALDARPGLVAIQAASALRIIDVSTPSAMVEVAAINAVNAFNDVVEFGQVDGTTVVYYINDNSRLDAKSLANPAAPAPLSAINTDGADVAAATADDHVFAVTNNTITAYSVSLVADPIATEVISTEPRYIAGLGVISNHLVAAYDNKLVVHDVTDPASPIEVSSITLPNDTRALEVEDDLAIVATVDEIRVYDLSVPANPVLLSTMPTISMESLAIDQHTLYATTNPMNAVLSWDISDPAHPVANPALNFVSPVGFRRLIASDATLYLVTAQSVRIYDASNPAQPVLASTLTPSGLGVSFTDAVVRGRTLVTLTSFGRTEFFDTSNRESPDSISSYTPFGVAGGTLTLVDTLLITSGFTYGDYVDLTDVADPSNPNPLPQTLRIPAPLTKATASNATTLWAGNAALTGIDAFRLPGAPRVAIDPVNTPACATTASASLSVTLANPLGASYQWRKGGVDLSDGLTAWGSTITGALSPTITITDGAVQDLGLYDCRITNSCDTVTTRDALLFLGIAPTILEHPHDAQVCPAGSVTLSTAWVGTLPATFKWEAEFPVNSGTYIRVADATYPRFSVSGATTRFLTIAANPGQTLPVALVETRYRCVIDNPCATETTNPATLTVLDASAWTCIGCAPCPADYDQDGGVTGGDLAAFFTDFEQGATCADVDQDGGVTGADLGVFFAAFEAGGC